MIQRALVVLNGWRFRVKHYFVQFRDQGRHWGKSFQNRWLPVCRPGLRDRETGYFPCAILKKILTKTVRQINCYNQRSLLNDAVPYANTQ